MAYTLPAWAQDARLRTLLAGPNNPALTGAEIGNSSVSGGGMGLLDTDGFYNAGLGQYSGSSDGVSGGWNPGRYAEFNDMLKNSGQSLYEAGDNGQIARWMQDAQGNITAEPQVTSTEDNNFWTAAMLAGAVTGANLYSAYGGAGAAASGGGAASGAGMTAEQVATLAANGLTDAQIAGMATAAGDTAMASSLTGAGMGGGGGGLFGGMFNNLDAGKIGGGLLDYAAKNPKVVGGLLGGLTGATGGLDSGGGGEAPYTGPMQTISRGGWQPRAQAQQMALPTFGQGLKTAQGNANSGLWRFMGGK